MVRFCRQRFYWIFTVAYVCRLTTVPSSSIVSAVIYKMKIRIFAAFKLKTQKPYRLTFGRTLSEFPHKNENNLLKCCKRKSIANKQGKLTFHSLWKQTTRFHPRFHFCVCQPCLVNTFLLSSCIPSCKHNKTWLLPVSLGQFFQRNSGTVPSVVGVWYAKKLETGLLRCGFLHLDPLQSSKRH